MYTICSNLHWCWIMHMATWWEIGISSKYSLKFIWNPFGNIEENNICAVLNCSSGYSLVTILQLYAVCFHFGKCSIFALLYILFWICTVWIFLNLCRVTLFYIKHSLRVWPFGKTMFKFVSNPRWEWIDLLDLFGFLINIWSAHIQVLLI